MPDSAWWLRSPDVPLQGPGLWVPGCTPRGGDAGPRTPVQSAAARLSRQRLAGGGRAARVPTEASWALSLSCLWGRVKESPSSCHIWGLWSLLPPGQPPLRF